MSNKLSIDKNGIEVQVVESSLIGGKEQLVVGNYDRDLILRTKGAVKVQIQNKFVNLISDELVDNSSEDVASSVIFVTNIDPMQSYPEQTLIIETSTGKIYYYINGTLTESGQDQYEQNFVSYVDAQSLSETQKKIALKNLGYVYNSLTDVSLPYYGQLVYDLSQSKHFYFTDVWNESYLHLKQGGQVENNVVISETPEISSNSLLGIYGPAFTSFIQSSSTEFPGLFIGLSDLTKGTGFYNDNFNNFVVNSTNAQNIVFRINNLSNTLYTDILKMNNSNVAIGSDTSYSDVYSLAVTDGGIIDELELQDYLHSSSIFSPIYSKGYEYDLGLSAVKGIEDDSFILAVDRLILKSPESTFNLNGVNGQLYISDTYNIEYFQNGSPPIITLSNIDGLVVNDILAGMTFNWDRSISELFFAKILSIDTLTLEAEIELYGEYNTYLQYSIIKVGNSAGTVNNILLDSLNNNIKIVQSTITSIEDLFTVFPDPEDIEDTPSFERPIYSDITTVIGNLNEIVNSDFSLNNNDEFGIYSLNAYIQGEAILDSLTLGNQLTWDGTTLAIADLETLKSRTITGANGLTGGGNLFAANQIISHAAGSWTPKTTLSEATVISNLSVDTYGHLTNWTTRNLTPANLGAEPAFAKNTAFNKNFGTVADTVAQGNDSRILNGQTAFSWGNYRDYGLGTAFSDRINITDVTHLMASGFYATGTTTNNVGIPGSSGTLITSTSGVSAGANGFIWLKANNTEIPQAFITHTDNTGDMKDWAELHHTGNLKIFTYTTSGGGVSVKSFTIPHGLDYTPTMVIATGNSEDTMIGDMVAGASVSGGFRAYIDGSNIVIDYDNNIGGGVGPVAGTNNLTWTILVK